MVSRNNSWKSGAVFLRKDIFRVKTIVDKVYFPEVRFDVGESIEGEAYIRAIVEYDDREPHNGEKVVVQCDAPQEVIVELCFRAVMTTLESFAKKDFLYRGQPVLHFKVDSHEETSL